MRGGARLGRELAHATRSSAAPLVSAAAAGAAASRLKRPPSAADLAAAARLHCKASTGLSSPRFTSRSRRPCPDSGPMCRALSLHAPFAAVGAVRLSLRARPQTDSSIIFACYSKTIGARLGT